MSREKLCYPLEIQTAVISFEGQIVNMCYFNLYPNTQNLGQYFPNLDAIVNTLNTEHALTTDKIHAFSNVVWETLV